MTETVLAIVFVVVSLLSTGIQLRSLWLLWRLGCPAGLERLAHRGLVRTSACRVLAAVTYVVFGLTVFLAQSAEPLLGLIVFSAVQILWQINGVADVRLRKKIGDIHT